MSPWRHWCHGFPLLLLAWAIPAARPSLLPMHPQRNILFFIIFWLPCTACAILVPQPGIKPTLPAVEAWILTSGPPGESQAEPSCKRLCWWHGRILPKGWCSGPHSSPTTVGLILFFKKFLFVYWLLCVFVTVLRLSLVAASSCGVWASYCGGFSCFGAWALGTWTSVAVARGLSCPMACGIF